MGTPSEATTTTEAPDANYRINSADEAGELISARSRVIRSFFEVGTGDELRLRDTEAMIDLYDHSAIVFDLVPLHECLIGRFTELRVFLGDDVEVRYSTDVTRVVEVRDGLWIVESQSTTFLTGLGESMDEAVSYVGHGGLIADSRFDVGVETDPCFNPETTPLTPAGRALFDEAKGAAEIAR